VKFISGGYYIVTLLVRPDYMDEGLIPNTILSASECLCDFHPDMSVLWGGSNKTKLNYAQQLHISQSTYEEMEKWIEDKYEAERFAYPQMFTNVKEAREFCNKYLNHLSNAKVIGIGLPENCVDEFIEYEETQNRPEKNQYGIEKLILNKTLIEEKDSKILGFEVLGFENGTFYSYLCNGLEKDFKEHFGFTLNKNGFISSVEEATRFCDYSNDEEVGTEPVLWLPWAIFEYAN
jgi:hypothetical protein